MERDRVISSDRLIFFLLWPLFFLPIADLMTPVWAGETETPQTPATLFGPSGLLFTQGAETLPQGRVEVGFSMVNEQSSENPDYTIDELSAVITAGLTNRVEIAGRIPYMFNFESHGVHDKGIEGGDLSIKWRFLDRDPLLPLPSLALSLTYSLPPTDKDHTFPMLERWGLKALLVASTEADLSLMIDYYYYVGFYADAGAYVQNLHHGTEEKHEIVDLGVLFPLSESQRLQFILEGNATFKDEIPLEGNYKAVTGGLRYAGSFFSLTGGVQRRFKEKDAKDADRLIFQASYLF